MSISAVIGIWGVALVTPGPNALVTINAATSSSRRYAMGVVGGIALGTLLWVSLGYFGVHVLLSVAPAVFNVAKLLGALYLMYLGARLFFVPSPMREATLDLLRHQVFTRGVRSGLMTNLANPKSIIFISSVFATAIPLSEPRSIVLLAGLVMVMMSVVWYGFLGILATTSSVSRFLRKFELRINRISGLCFIGFGLKIFRSS